MLRRRSSRGFTLIELLVVTGILATAEKCGRARVPARRSLGLARFGKFSLNGGGIGVTIPTIGVGPTP